MEIEVIIPWGADGNLGAAYNRLMRDCVKHWVCFIDHDILNLNPEWYRLLLGAVKRLGQAGGWITGTPNVSPVSGVVGALRRGPGETYASVPMAVIHAGMKLKFVDRMWVGTYELMPSGVIDGAKRFSPGMYQGGLHCPSFHAKKILAIGRGGVILTDSPEAATWLRKARYDGREGKPYQDEQIDMLGWHCYMTPEQAARGMFLMDILPESPPALGRLPRP